MTVSQAARFIGCSERHIRTLIKSGKLAATRVPKSYGYTWDISRQEANRFKQLPLPERGYPRGRSRKQEANQ